MPSEKVLKEKQEIVTVLAEKLQSAVAGVLVDYKGINVGADTKLRKELRGAGVEYMVVKNNMLRRAFDSVGYGELDSVLHGTTALAISTNDPVSAAKILKKYADTTKDAFKLKAGFVEGNVLDAAGIIALATLPSREELVARTLRGMNAPISGFVNVLNGNLRGLVVALDQIAKKSA